MEALPDFMQNEISEYRQERDRQQRIAARLMLKNQLKQDGVPHLFKQWTRDARNRPVVPNWRPFSISYSKDIVLFANGETEIGIDVEFRQPVDAAALSQFFSAEERQYILAGNDSEKQLRFYEVWVKKEAILKAIGVGIVEGLDTFSCLENTVDLRGKTWHFYPLDLGKEYTCFLCSNAQDIAIELAHFAPIEAD